MFALRVARVGVRTPSVFRPRVGAVFNPARLLSTGSPDMKPPCDRKAEDSYRHRRGFHFHRMMISWSTIGDMVGHASGAVFMLVGLLAFYHFSGLEWVVDTYREAKGYVRAKTRAIKQRASDAFSTMREKSRARSAALRERVLNARRSTKDASLSNNSSENQDDAGEHAENATTDNTKEPKGSGRSLEVWAKSRGGSQ